MRNTERKALGACLLLLSACSRKEAAETESPAPVQVTAVTQDTVRRIVAGEGVLFALDQTLVTPKIQAPVQKFYVNRGDHVKQGQLLAVLENRDLMAAAAEAKGAVDQAESNLRSMQGATVPESLVKAQADADAARQAMEAAKKVWDSRQDLLRQGALSRRQVDEAQMSYVQANSTYLAAQEHLRALQNVSKVEQLKTAESQVETARAHYQSLAAQVQFSRIVSPINGVVADRPLYAGEIAQPGTSLLTVMDISRVVARVNVPQAQASILKTGQPAVVTLTDSQAELHGKVTVVSPAADANSTTVQVWVEIANSGEVHKPGASVRAAIIAESFKAATVVPPSAILPGEDGGDAILVISSDSVAHKRPVRLGVREGGKVQVLSGANPGETVVVVGGMGIDDKAKVKIIDTTVKEPDEDVPEESAPAPAQKKGLEKSNGK